VKDGEATAAQPEVSTVREFSLPQSGVVRAAMRLNVNHLRQRFPISTVHYAADSAHFRLAPLRPFYALTGFQFIDLGFRMKHLHRLKSAIDQARNAVHETAPQKIAIEEKQHRRAGDRVQCV